TQLQRACSEYEVLEMIRSGKELNFLQDIRQQLRRNGYISPEVFGMFNSLLKINSYSIYPHFEEIIDILYALVNEDRLETYTYQFFSALLVHQVQYFEDAIVSQVNDLQSLKILAPHIKNNIARIVRLCALNIIFQEKINSPKS